MINAYVIHKALGLVDMTIYDGFLDDYIYFHLEDIMFLEYNKVAELRRQMNHGFDDASDAQYAWMCIQQGMSGFALENIEEFWVGDSLWLRYHSGNIEYLTVFKPLRIVGPRV